MDEMGVTVSVWSDSNRQGNGARAMDIIQVDEGPHGKVGWLCNWYCMSEIGMGVDK